MTATRITPQFSPNALRILHERYLLPDETPEQLIDRCSFGNPDYYNLMASLDFLPNSPTLFNAGLDTGTLSACFKFDIGDSLVGDSDTPFSKSIMGVASKAAAVLKYGGGVGYCLSDLRPSGSVVRTTHKVASGPVGWMKIYQAVADSITQGGRRHGAQMAILHCDHPDVEQFIHCKDKNPQALNTFNISVAATDEWMKHWTNGVAFEVDQKPVNLLWEMAQSAWRTGDPGLYFIDTAERANPTPWLGKLTGTNPCGEVPLLDNEPCNLGSINLGHFVDVINGQVLWQALENTTRLAIRYLDDVLDHNSFPHEDITKAALTTRKLGLGVMGWADMLAYLQLPYNGGAALDLGEQLMRSINGWAYSESIKLAMSKGEAPWAREAPGHNGKNDDNLFPRNATRTCIAPTGSISILADASSGIEPHFAHRTRHDNGHGRVIEIDYTSKFLPFVPAVANELSYEAHLQHQQVFQENTDLAVSKTINMPESATVEDIYNAYVMAWKLGCKGVTVFRDNSRGQQVLSTVEDTTTIVQERIEAPQPSAVRSDDQLASYTQPSITPPVPEALSNGRTRLPDERRAIVHKFQVGELEGYVTVGQYEDGTPGELFIQTSKQGSTLNGFLDTIGILTSLCLQYHVPVSVLVNKLSGINFEPNGLTGNPKLRTATSVVDYIFRWIGYRFGEKIRKANGIAKEYNFVSFRDDGKVTVETTFLDPKEVFIHIEEDRIVAVEPVLTDYGMLCPDCGVKLIPQSGCMLCTNCGYEKCG